MQNLYIIYVTTIETGDSKLIKAYSSFTDASKNLRSIIDWYISENCNNDKIKIISNDKSILDTIRNDKDFINGYYFCIKKNSVIIYKKVTDLGWIRNNKTILKIGKIGIDELCVQISDKNNSLLIDNTIQPLIPISSSLEHGQHVSLIEELKSVINKRSQDAISINDKIIYNESKPIINPIKEKFISDLKEMKTKLKPIYENNLADSMNLSDLLCSN